MTQPSETPTEPGSWHAPDWVVYARGLAESLSAARSALAEKERELTEVQAEAFDKIMAAEARAAKAEKDAQRYRRNRDLVYDDLEQLAKSLGPQMTWPSRKEHAAAYDAKIDTLGEGKATDDPAPKS